MKTTTTEIKGTLTVEVGTVTVVNQAIHRHRSPMNVFIGRPSVFGNPFTITETRIREECIALYEKYFNKRIAAKDELYDAVEKLVERVRNGEHLFLLCFCSPYLCHGDVIKKYIYKQLGI